MTILSDKEIELLCQPVHGEYYTANWEHKELVMLDNKLYDANTGQYINTNFEGTVKETYEHQPMIEPFIPHQVRAIKQEDGSDKKIISYGLSSYSYDFRVAPEFLVFTNTNSVIIDPLDIDEKAFVKVIGDKCVIPPNSFVLARTIEYFKMPKNVTGILYPKSTYARTGNLLFPTVIEAGWEGQITLEYANSTPLPIVLHANMGGGAIVFFRGQNCRVPYNLRDGKYMKQTGITLPKV